RGISNSGGGNRLRHTRTRILLAPGRDPSTALPRHAGARGISPAVHFQAGKVVQNDRRMRKKKSRFFTPPTRRASFRMTVGDTRDSVSARAACIQLSKNWYGEQAPLAQGRPEDRSCRLRRDRSENRTSIEAPLISTSS